MIINEKSISSSYSRTLRHRANSASFACGTKERAVVFSQAK